MGCVQASMGGVEPAGGCVCLAGEVVCVVGWVNPEPKRRLGRSLSVFCRQGRGSEPGNSLLCPDEAACSVCGVSGTVSSELIA